MHIVYLGFHVPPFWLSFCYLLFLVPQLLDASLQAVSDSNPESVFYEAVYDAASTIDYSREPIDAGVVDSPPPKKIFRPSPSPSPLKGGGVAVVSGPDLPLRSNVNAKPSRRLRMDVPLARDTPLHVPLPDNLAVRAISAKVRYSHLSPSRLFPLSFGNCFGLPP